MENVRRKYLTLRPMTNGAAGFARLEYTDARVAVQFQGKGLARWRCATVCAYRRGDCVAELGACTVNPQGQAALMAELRGAQDIAAVFAVSEEPSPCPLLLGVCDNGAGSVMDARNAVLAYCARKERMNAACASRCAHATGGTDARPLQAAKAAECSSGFQRAPKETPQAHSDEPCAEGRNGVAASEAADNREACVPDRPEKPLQTKPSSAKPAASGLPQAAQEEPQERVPPLARPLTGAHRIRRDPAPQEVFLPAVDPCVYMTAERSRQALDDDARRIALPNAVKATVCALDAAQKRTETNSRRCADHLPERSRQDERREQIGTLQTCREKRQSGACGVDRLPERRWPKAVQGLAAYFEQYRPFALFDAAGWRFVRVPMQNGFFAVGRLCVDESVRQILYALPGTRDEPPPKEMKGYRYCTGKDGQGYWAHLQTVGE